MIKPTLPSTWIVVTIGEILKPQSDGKLIHQGWSPRCHTVSTPKGEWGVLKTTAIQDGFYLEYENKHLPNDKDPKPRIEVKDGDLLMTNAGPRMRCGVTTLVNKTRKKLMISGKMYRMRFDEDFIYPKYIEACLRSNEVKKEIDDRKTGMSESGLNLTQKRFLSVPLILCPQNEQIRIANKLDSLLAKVETTQKHLDKIPTLLKRYRQSVLAAAVSGELTKEWRGIQSFGSEISIGEISEKIRYGTSKKCSTEIMTTAVLRIPNIKSGSIDFNNLKYADFNEKELEGLSLKKGDILMIRSNGSINLVGKVALVNKLSETTLYAGYLMRIRIVDQTSYLPEYVSYALQSPQIRKKIELTARSTSGVNNINSKELNSLSFYVPKTIKEQKQIVKRVEALFALADKVEQQYQAAKQRTDKLTQSILAKAFRGELVPQDPNDEPASELLKRIKAETIN